jgi:DivIVA protein
VIADDTLQRTLLLAQKFVDETKADSEAQAARVVAEAEAKAREVTESAQSRASLIAAESEQRLREEIARLEESRIRLTGQVESMSSHLESERNRLRTALGDILRWVDQNVQPSSSSPDASHPEPGPVDSGESTGSGPTPASATVIQGGNRPTNSPPVAPAPASSGTGPTGEVTQVRPSGGMTRPATSNAPLPL